ncbi:hypothetical protein [Streptomyces roseus]|uniref:DinB-like domain-containing protein n=1 Tax=Streptomyces roseus TaxID=66430 RepID=A0A0J6XPT4_9ACTN|nr:hypothetical protein [Streptomyces roseus]KMO97244.1 hypothetical protein ACS04_13905 [Streptomyces roseus]
MWPDLSFGVPPSCPAGQGPAETPEPAPATVQREDPAASVRALLEVAGDRDAFRPPLRHRHRLRLPPAPRGHRGQPRLPRLPFRRILLAWTRLRASNVALLAAPSPEDRRRTGRRGEQGDETTEVTIRKVIGHDIAHISQIYRAIRPVREAAGLDVAELDATYESLGLR